MKLQYYFICLLLVLLAPISNASITLHDTHVPAIVEVVQFSPDCDAHVPLIELVKLARKTVYVSIFSFYEDEIAKALIKAKKKGIDVKVLVDDLQAAGSPVDEKLLEKHVDVRLDRRSGYHHDKFIVVDERWVLTGSMNFSNNGRCRNRENYLVLYSTEVAAIYHQRFLFMWEKYGSAP